MTQFELISVEFNRANLSKMPDHKQGACGKLITLTDHHCIHTMEQEAGSSPRPNSYILLTSSAVAYRPYPYQTLTLVPTLTRVPRRFKTDIQTDLYQTQRQIRRSRLLKKRTAFRPNYDLATSSIIYSAERSAPYYHHYCTLSIPSKRPLCVICRISY